MFNEERQEKILEVMNQKNKVTVKELSSMFGVSDVTVRKDLNDLCGAGLAVRTHGGAMKRTSTRFELNQEEKAREAYKEKEAIAGYAFREICDGETIMLYGGSTVQELARKIKTVAWKDLTVVTNALNIANELADAEGVSLLFVGGTMRKRILTCVGPMAEEALNQLVVDRSFVSVNCVSLEYGLTAANITEGCTVRSMLQAGLRKYLLVHSGKFENNSIYRICGVDDVQVIITDDQLDPELAERYEERKCQLVRVKVE